MWLRCVGLVLLRFDRRSPASLRRELYRGVLMISLFLGLLRIFGEWVQSAERDDEHEAKRLWVTAKNLLKRAALKETRGG